MSVDNLPTVIATAYALAEMRRAHDLRIERQATAWAAADHPAITAAILGYQREIGGLSTFLGLADPAKARRVRAERLHYLRFCAGMARLEGKPLRFSPGTMSRVAAYRAAEHRLRRRQPKPEFNGFALILPA